MSRKSDLKRVRRVEQTRAAVNGSVRQFPPQVVPRPPVQQQLDACMAGINKLANLFMELDLQIEFTMRQIIMKRAIPGSLITSTDGKPQFETLNLLKLYELQRESFATFLMEERRATLEAQRAARAASGGDTAPATSDTPAGPIEFPGATPKAE